MKNYLTQSLFAGSMVLLGLIGGSALLASAQTNTTTATDTPGQHGWMHHMGGQHQHAPLGGDGNVESINGTTLMMREEADEGGGLYTVDATNATVTKDGTPATLTDIKVGDKIFVHGTTNGAQVQATSIAVGHPHMKDHDHKAWWKKQTN